MIVIENNSTDPATFTYYEELQKNPERPRCKVVEYKSAKGCKFSAGNNFGRRAAKGEYRLLLNNDV